MKRTGRPPLDEHDDSVPVHVTMTTRQYDVTFKRAQAARVSVPEILRRDNHAANEKKNAK